MKKKKQIKQNIINIVVFAICLSLIYTGSLIIKRNEDLKSNISQNIEIEWRAQAKRTLANVREQFMYDVKHNVVDPSNEASLQEWAKRNISGVLNGGDTSDAFMINLSNEKFIWDGSPDCAKPEFITNGRYMKDEAAMHADKAQATYIINKMRLGTDTINSYEKNWWNFDGSPEYLEWIVIPPGYLGFDYESKTVGGVKNKEYKKVLIALGTQKDEVESTYINTYKEIDAINNMVRIFVSISVIICVFNMIIYIYFLRKI